MYINFFLDLLFRIFVKFKKNCEIIIFMWCDFVFDRWRDGSVFIIKTRFLCIDFDFYKYGYFLFVVVCLGYKSFCYARL